VNEAARPRRRRTPPGVGPHEGKELDLMLAGTKPLALFSDAVEGAFWFPEGEFAPYVAAGRILRFEDVTPPRADGHAIRRLFYCLPGEEWRVEAARALQDRSARRDRPWTDEDDRAMGRLLGYREEDIEAFLAWFKIAWQRARRRCPPPRRGGTLCVNLPTEPDADGGSSLVPVPVGKEEVA
jgi:hypothetical protein